MRIDDLYNCECEDCKNDLKPNYVQLASDKPSIDAIINAGFEALKYLHAQGSYNYKDLNKEPYKNLINKTNYFLSKAVTDNNVTDFMRDAFKNDIFIFSHLRTHAQLQEAGSLLLTEDGKIKSFDRFKLDIAKINGLYNENYLQAEYQFAVSSVQMGEKWQNYVESDRYNLQYRTAQDDKVRISHQPLHGITLPMNNPFWDKFYPPNGWRCRCNAAQVRASKSPATNEENALKAGNIATTQIGKDNKNRLEIFRFNSGKQRIVFPPSHPYNKVKDADKIKESVTYSDLTMDDLKNNYSKQKVNTKNEKIVMNSGTGYIGTSNSFYLNGKLRNNEDLSIDDKITIKALDKLINDNYLSNNIILKRFVSDDFINSHFNIDARNKTPKEVIKLLENTGIIEFSDKGYTSTSAIELKNVFFNRKYKLEIRAKKGTNAFIANNFEESEIILGRNQKIRIIGFEETNRGQIKIVAETF